jgi:two-component system cell cycle response regulator
MTSPPVDILLVEDSQTQAELIRHALEECGYGVRPARDGIQALDLAREKTPTLVVSDVMMPGLDGYGLCRALKGDPATCAVPVILLTTLTDPADIVRGIESGADNFICKPFSPEVLLERIAFFLQNGALRRSQMFELLLSAFDTLRRKTEQLERAYHDLKNGRCVPLPQKDAIRICAKCKKVQDDRGEWIPVEEFLRRTAGLTFTHEFCGQCGDGLMRKPECT